MASKPVIGNRCAVHKRSYPSPLEETIRYTFKNRALLDHAITHTSSLKEEEQRAKSDNEKLEYLGDAILNTVISILLYRKYRDRNEGFLSNARSVLVKRDALTEIARNLELEIPHGLRQWKISRPQRLEGSLQHG